MSSQEHKISSLDGTAAGATDQERKTSSSSNGSGASAGAAASADSSAAPAASLDDGIDDSRMLDLLSKDGKRFPMLMRNLRACKLVMTAVDHDKDVAELPVTLSAKILEKVCTYMQHHEGVAAKIIPAPLRSVVMKDVVEDKWDATYIDDIQTRSLQDLYDLILAANYLDINCLLHLGCAKVASLIKDKPLEEIPNILQAKDSKTATAGAGTGSASGSGASASSGAESKEEKVGETINKYRT